MCADPFRAFPTTERASMTFPRAPLRSFAAVQRGDSFGDLQCLTGIGVAAVAVGYVLGELVKYPVGPEPI